MDTMEGEHYKKFGYVVGKKRVDDELDEFMKFKFIKRSGGGIGVTRMIRAMQRSNLIPQ